MRQKFIDGFGDKILFLFNEQWYKQKSYLFKEQEPKEADLELVTNGHMMSEDIPTIQGKTIIYCLPTQKLTSMNIQDI